MRIWVQVFSSRDRNPNFHMALEEHLRSVVEPGVEIEVHGTRKGGLGEQFRFFQAIDMPDIIESVLKCKEAKGEQRYDAFVSLNSTDPALYEAREILDIPVLGFLETASFMSCMMGNSFSLITPNPKFALSYSQRLKLYGITERLASIEAMDFPHLPDYRNAFIDPAAHQRVMDEFDRAARRAVQAGAEVIIPCGSHAVLQARRGLREIDGALIIDGLGILIKMAETAVRIKQMMGTFVSRKLLYQMPSEIVRERARKEYGIDLS
ncbi:MAG: aspartate/glutamate racemase family protein [Burkholderiales bacterium]